MIPLLPPGGIFQSTDNSKLSYSSDVMMSARISLLSVSLPLQYSSPFFAAQQSAAFPWYIFQPLRVLPSNNNFQPSFFSAAVNVLSFCAAADKELITAIIKVIAMIFLCFIFYLLKVIASLILLDNFKFFRI